MTRDSTNPREMFDEIPEGAFLRLKKALKEVYEIIETHYDPHTEITIRNGEATIKRDVLNTYV